ncbi:MAG: carbamoyl-phosphate synthase large subunit [Candidatus Levybacteria bacterium]|nr:carbamoyl-phosphate synthase large subunit [Candidatus Levybacteria bacterium]
MNKKLNKVLILGSGALKIGEAGEFDYSGSQAIKALKEERIKTILVNPNIATVQTSKLLADTVYFLPVNDYFVEKVIAKEKPDGILLSFGGQTALNCGLTLYKKGVLKKHNVAILGTPIEAIQLSEDRDLFTTHLRKLDIPTPLSKTATTVFGAKKIAQNIGYPIMVRSGFALGGQGSGIARNEAELEKIATKALSFVNQILIEQYLHHFKEVEYEVVRDKDDNCITVCNMENMDPLGIHTGESIVVAPSQTLTNFEYHYLRQVAIKIVRSLKIVGECNVQFALNPHSKSITSTTSTTSITGEEKNDPSPRGTRDTLDTRGTLDYFVIELNARLSRSSALASKATGYPLAYVAAKLAIGKNLTEIKNKVTRITQSCFEPALDYIVVKIPRWDIEKFKGANERIGTSMKSVGEVMGVGRTFEEALQKAIRMLDIKIEGVTSNVFFKNNETIEQSATTPTPKRVFAISHAIKKGISIEEIYKKTGIDPWFLHRIKNIVDKENELVRLYSSSKRNASRSSSGKSFSTSSNNTIPKATLLQLKQLGCSDKRIAVLTGQSELAVRKLRKSYGIIPSVFQIDTLGGEFPAKTNYLYLTYNGSHNDIKPAGKKGIVVLGSGPYRIGSSVEFDWTSVATVQQVKKNRKQSIIINCNPETVSTDYDISDRLYFEELTFERIADVYDFENPFGVIVSVGGQTPNNRANALKDYGAHILGTDPANIDRAEDRNKFSKLLDEIGVEQPSWDKFTDLEKALQFCKKVQYPVLLRPSYVLSGTMMRVCHNYEELIEFVKDVAHISKEYPVTISKFIEEAKEIELDAVAQNGAIVASVISEHIENAGVHSGDATIVLPPQKLTEATKKRIEEIGRKLANEFRINGPFNIQFLAKEDNVSVIEINLRASRTFPFISKVTGVDFIELAVDAFFGKQSNNAVVKQLPFVAVKVSQFSFARLTGSDPVLHVEMSSTGEVASFGEDTEEAFLKGELAVGGKIPKKGIFVSLGGNENKERFLEAAKLLPKLKLPIYATEKTAQFLIENGVKAIKLHKIFEHQFPNVLDYFQKGKIDLTINLVETAHPKDETDHYTIRRAAIDHNIPIYTNRQKAKLFVKAITTKKLSDLAIKSWDEYCS